MQRASTVTTRTRSARDRGREARERASVADRAAHRDRLRRRRISRASRRRTARPLGADEVKLTKEALGWPQEPTFLVPDDVRAWLAERIDEKQAERAARDARFDDWRSANPASPTRWDARASAASPRISSRSSPTAGGQEGRDAQALRRGDPARRGRAAVPDRRLGGSRRVEQHADQGRRRRRPGARPGADPFAGRNLHFGMREHAMGSLANGIALDGTFLPTSRRSWSSATTCAGDPARGAAWGCAVVFVFTHDSIFLGEDGPDAPADRAARRAARDPGLTVFRPADGLETAMAWAWALEQAQGPVVLALTRQTLPPLERPPASIRATSGAARYVAARRRRQARRRARSRPAPRCRSRVAAAEMLAADGIAARVSCRCRRSSCFAAQPDADQHAILPDDGTPIVAHRGGARRELRRFVGRRGLVLGIETLRRLRPDRPLAEHFGFTPASVAKRVKAHV